jgi:UDP-2,3-diacylglucosamine pyrophosphatase LpxH
MEVKKKKRRKPEIVIISDTHLGTYGCRAAELLLYLKSIDPRILILNGDIIDIWQFRKRFFPGSHLQVIKYLTGRIAKGKKVIYVTGNHDEMLRKFVKFKLGSFELVNKVLMEIDGKKAWIFHGDVFDITMQYSKWLARLGSFGYDLLIILNNMINFLLVTIGRDKISFSRRIKNSVKTAVAFINKFEETAAEIAIRNHYDYVICGHIHHPEIKSYKNHSGEVLYLNSGDWIENLSSLEYSDGEWTVYHFCQDHFEEHKNETDPSIDTSTTKELFRDLLRDFRMMS